MAVLGTGSRLAKRPEEVLGATVLQPLSTVLEKQLVVSAQALLQSQQLIHSSQLTLKLQVSGWR